MSCIATASPSAWINASEAAALLAVDDARVVHRLVAEGRLTARPLPTQKRFLRADVERLASERMTAGA